jgi:polyribonucleotide nucleotidyltransferase
LDGEASVLGDEEPVSEPETDDTVITDDAASAKDIVASVSSTSDEDEASEIVHPPHRFSSAKRLPTLSTGYEAMEVKKAIKKLMGRKLRDLVQSTGRRADGRRIDEVRPLSMETSWLPGTHGSALFTRYVAAVYCPRPVSCLASFVTVRMYLFCAFFVEERRKPLRRLRWVVNRWQRSPRP